jgi:hypothetical protein
LAIDGDRRLRSDVPRGAGQHFTVDSHAALGNQPFDIAP